jgi:hypothetical protein
MGRKKKINQGTVTWHVPDRVRRLYEQISEEFNMTYTEITAVARAIASVELDPLQGGDGDPFSFERPRSDDPFPPMVEWLSPRVPAPDALVNLLDAKIEFDRDCDICLKLWKGKPSLDELVAISRNQWAWCLFWSVRHQSAKEREYFQGQLDEIRPWREKAQASAKRQLKKFYGIDVDAGGTTQ